MKVFAIHDAAGTISDIITAPDHAPPVGMVTRAGLSMTEVHVPAGIKLVEGANGGDVKQLADLIQNYQVIVEPKIAKLKRRDDSAS
jgi:hypothetical protein